MSRELIFSATKKDFKLDWFSGTGAGGQHRNKHKNCVRITHIPTGLTAQCQEHKERPQNQKIAFKKLAHMVVADYLNKRKHQAQLGHTKVNEVIRTYHEPNNRVKDYASGFIQTYDHVVKKNNIEGMVQARFEKMNE